MLDTVLKKVSPSDWLSLFRIPLAALFPFLTMWGQLFVLFLAGLSDLLDGMLARRYGWGTPLGKVVDPLSDKVFAALAAATLLVQGEMPLTALPFFFARDIALILFILEHKLFDSRTPFLLQGITAGKLSTTLQFIVLFALVLGKPYPPTFNLFFLGLGIASFFELRLVHQSRKTV